MHDKSEKLSGVIGDSVRVRTKRFGHVFVFHRILIVPTMSLPSVSMNESRFRN